MIDRIRMPQMDLNGQPLRVGAVSYLNSKPLIEGIAESMPGAAITLDLPSRLAEGLARQDLDVALIPSVESFSNPDYEIISDACVAARGPVLSVKFYSRIPPGEVKSLALDEGSRTSAALVRIMLHERYGVDPSLEILPIGSRLSDSRADGVLVIGDRAMTPPKETFHTTWDLGEEWLRWTGLPFVFAMWVGRSDVKTGGLDKALENVRDRGLQNIEAIGRREAIKLGLRPEDAIEYLTQHLHFQLGSAERSGLRLFHRLATRLGLAKESASPQFRSDRAHRGLSKDRTPSMKNCPDNPTEQAQRTGTRECDARSGS